MTITPPGHRLPADLRLGPVRLQVADLERSKAFYGSVLGLDVVDEEGGRAQLGTPGAGSPLVELHEASGAARAPRGGRPGLYHYAILLPGRSALGSFAAHAERTGVSLGAADHRVSEALYLHDPDGLGIEVYADRPATAWEVRGGELVMRTDPLDMDDLLGAAAGRQWTGMPAGARIGHVHLHVGDLGRAEAFYHAALGFDKTVWSYPGALFLSAGGYHHHLGVNTWARGTEPAGPRDARLLEWVVELPSDEDVEAAARALEEAGHPVDVDPDGIRAADPWGTRLRVRTGSAGEG